MMISRITFLALLQAFAISAVSAASVSGAGSEVITVGEHQIRVATAPVPASLLSSTNVAGRSLPGTSLTKRVTNNGCFAGCVRTCTNLLSPLPDPPLAADCTALQVAMKALAQSEIGGAFPCNLPSAGECPNFTVAPGFERTYSLGTCLIGFANVNPAGGASISYCDYLMAGFMNSMYQTCVVTAGNTGGYCGQFLNTGIFYILSLRHA